MKLLQNPIIVGLLVVLALALIFRNSFGPITRFFSKKAPPAQLTPPQFAVEIPPVTNVFSPTATNAPESEVPWKKVEFAKAQWTRAPKRDPFQFVPLPDWYRIVATSNSPSLSAPVKTAREMLALRAIWLQTGSQLAVLNSAIVGEGSSILDYKVEKIEQDKVWVSGPLGLEKVDFASFRGTNAPATNSYPASGPDLKPISPSLKN